jgi:hypothetical protein
MQSLFVTIPSHPILIESYVTPAGVYVCGDVHAVCEIPAISGVYEFPSGKTSITCEVPLDLDSIVGLTGTKYNLDSGFFGLSPAQECIVDPKWSKHFLILESNYPLKLSMDCAGLITVSTTDINDKQLILEQLRTKSITSR